MKDRELTRLLQAHPEEGLEAAMLEYAPLVKGILCRILPQNPCDREECMAGVFVALWRSAAKLEAARTPLRPWLAVAARNRAIDCYNALRRRETVTLDDGLTETLGELAEFDPKFTGKRPLPPRNGSSSRSSSGKNWYGIISSRSFPERPERLSLTRPSCV